MDDIRNAAMLMRIVPATQTEFELLANQHFVAFLAVFGIRRDPLGRG